jgi:conjugal transfer pilus assembly protein TraE
MDLRFKNVQVSSLVFQRNVLAGLSLVLLVLLLLLSILLFFKNDRVIVLPPETKQGFWVEGDKFSSTYLEEQGMYFAHLLLDVSPSSIIPQGEILLRYTDSAVYGAFRSRLLNELDRLKKDSLSLGFSAVEAQVFPKELAVEITGDLNSYVAQKKISTHRETYRIEFSSHKGRLFLKSFKSLKSDNQNLSLPQELNVTS